MGIYFFIFFLPFQRLEEITHQFPNVTLRSASMVENLSSVDETAKVAGKFLKLLNLVPKK